MEACNRPAISLLHPMRGFAAMLAKEPVPIMLTL